MMNNKENLNKEFDEKEEAFLAENPETKEQPEDEMGDLLAYDNVHSAEESESLADITERLKLAGWRRSGPYVIKDVDSPSTRSTIEHLGDKHYQVVLQGNKVIYFTPPGYFPFGGVEPNA